MTDDVIWFDWDSDPYGNDWYEQRLRVYHPNEPAAPLPVTSAVSGPKLDDPIENVEFISNLWIVRWTDLYPGIPTGDEIPLDQQAWVSLSFYPSPEYFWGDFGTDGDATGCIIESMLPAPTMYQYCNTSDSSSNANMQLSFPADIVVVDLDVSLEASDTLSQTMSARLWSPAGANISLFANLLPVIDSMQPVFDDETSATIYDASYTYDNEFLPEESLTAFDGASAYGQWELSLTDETGQPHQADLDEWCLIVTGYRTVRYAGEGFQTAEGAGAVDVTVELSEPSTVTTTVSFATVPGDGSNQQPQSGLLTFAPGEQSKTFPVAINDDGDIEADESVQLQLSNPGNQYGLGDPAEANLTILDDDVIAYTVFLSALISGVQAPPPPPPDPIANPGFEDGPVHWIEYSLLGYALIFHSNDLPVAPHNGDWATWLGGDDDEISYIAQQVTVPADAPLLNYWHYIDSPDDCGYDFAGVVVDNAIVVDVYDLCASENTSGWVQKTVDMSAYAGQSIALQIRVETDVSLVSNLFVDDVSFQASPAAVATPAAPSSGVGPAPHKTLLLLPPNPGSAPLWQDRLFPGTLQR